jgi:hypothetical protein
MCREPLAQALEARDGRFGQAYEEGRVAGGSRLVGYADVVGPVADDGGDPLPSTCADRSGKILASPCR